MALHLRDRIVDAIGTLLTGLSTTSTRVYLDRVDVLEAAELPGLTIMQANESSEPLTVSTPRTMQAVLDVDVTCHSKLATGTLARKQLNLMTQEVQVAMAGDRSIGALAKVATLVQTDFDYSGDGEYPVGTARMRWQILYLYAENTPDVAQ